MRRLLGVLREERRRGAGAAAGHGAARRARRPGRPRRAARAAVGARAGRGRSPARSTHALPRRPGGADQRAQARRRRSRASTSCCATATTRSSCVVRDDGRGARRRGDGRGHGLVGMRERVGAARRHARRPARASDGGFEVARRRWCAGVSARIFLVDDQALVRAGFRMLIEAQPDMEVVGEAERRARRARGARRHARRRRADGRAHAASSTACRRPSGCSRDARPAAPKVIVLTTFDLDEYVFAAIRAGASGFLLKDARPEELLGAIRAVLGGDAVVAPSATRRLLEHVAGTLPRRPARTRGWSCSTPREREVLLEVARGRSNAEIARRPVHGRGDGQDPRRAAAGQARPARPRAARRLRLRDRPRARRRRSRSASGRTRIATSGGWKRAAAPILRHDRSTATAPHCSPSPPASAFPGRRSPGPATPPAPGRSPTRVGVRGYQGLGGTVGIAGTYEDPDGDAAGEPARRRLILARRRRRAGASSARGACSCRAGWSSSRRWPARRTRWRTR